MDCTQQSFLKTVCSPSRLRAGSLNALSSKVLSNEEAFSFVTSNPSQTDNFIKYGKPELGIAGKVLTYLGVVVVSQCCRCTDARSEFLYSAVTRQKETVS